MGVMYDSILRELENFDTSTIPKQLPVTAYKMLRRPLSIDVSSLIGGSYFVLGSKLDLLTLVNFLSVCLLVRNAKYNSLRSPRYSMEFPLASAMISLTICFVGSMVSGIFKGNPLADVKDVEVMAALVIWYFVNYSPFDIVFKIMRSAVPFSALILIKELYRLQKLESGVVEGMRLFGGKGEVRWAATLIYSHAKAFASTYLFYALVLGINKRTTFASPILYSSPNAKISWFVAAVLLASKSGRLVNYDWSYPEVWCISLLVSVFTRATSMCYGSLIYRIFSYVENLGCSLVFGGFGNFLFRNPNTRDAFDMCQQEENCETVSDEEDFDDGRFEDCEDDKQTKSGDGEEGQGPGKLVRRNATLQTYIEQERRKQALRYLEREESTDDVTCDEELYPTVSKLRNITDENIGDGIRRRVANIMEMDITDEGIESAEDNVNYNGGDGVEENETGDQTVKVENSTTANCSLFSRIISKFSVFSSQKTEKPRDKLSKKDKMMLSILMKHSPTIDNKTD